MPVSGNESNHVIDGLTVKGGLKIGDSGPYISSGDPVGLSLAPRRAGNGIEVPGNRAWGARTNFSTTSQALRLTNFDCPRDMLVSTVNVATDATAAGATPTLIRYGIYSVDPLQNITLIAATPNDTSMLAATTTGYPKALSTPVQLAAGQRYAMAFLIVTGAAAPSLRAPDPINISVQDSAVSSWPGAQLASQTDLPASVAVGSLSATGTCIYFYLT